MTADESIPVGERLGTQRLYSGEAEPVPLRAFAETYAQIREQDDEEPAPERRDVPRPERRDEPRPAHQDPRTPATPPHQPRRKRRALAAVADLNLTPIASNTAEVLGIMAITAGTWLFSARVGLLVLGLCLILWGIALGVGPGPRRPDAGG